MATTKDAVSSSIQAETHEILRRLADFPEDIWGDRFDSLAGDLHVIISSFIRIMSKLKKVIAWQGFVEMYTDEIESLKKQVKTMLITTDGEIENELEKIFNLQGNLEEYPYSYDLFTAALHFRLLRQHGFSISSGIFCKFMDTNGRFKETLSNDTRGLLSLYEATQVRTNEDSILEEALRFAVVHLNAGLLHEASSSLAKQVKYALMQSLHKCIPRIAARRFISIYEESDSQNEFLLRLAKLDFNFLQLLYKQELHEIIRWGKESEIISKLPYSRARLVESYLYGLGMFYEPQYSFGRIISAKTTLLLTAIDDTYDSYGTLDELQTFTGVIERWDAKEKYRLPSFLRTSFMALLSVSEGVEIDLARQGRLYASNKYEEEWKEYARKSYIEAQWFLKRELPTFPDYLQNGLTTSLCYLLIPTALLGVETATEDVYDWLATYPKILVSLAKICRLTNDIGSHEREKQIGSTGIECYMNHYNVSEREAMAKFDEMVENAWKDMNEECLKPTPISREILTRFFNLGRIVVCFTSMEWMDSPIHVKSSSPI